MAYLNPSDKRMFFVPLGGSGEIGMNLNLYGYQGHWMMVDCGMSFAGDGFPGIDLMFPDPVFAAREKQNLLGMVITHGHEDHIGAIPHLWRRFECPIYATPFTAALITDKLVEAGLEEDVEIRLVEDDKSFSIGPFEVTYIALAHSTAEGHGLAIKTDLGTVFHTGDWKLDPNPLIGPVCPSGKLEALGNEGVLALVGDSTNVFNPENAGSELAVKQRLTELCAQKEGRVVITTFASNVARLDTVGEVAKATGRHLVLLGRSMKRIYKAAKSTGYLQNFPTVLDEEDAGHLPRERVLICCTGCQGENRAALSRIARDEHRYLTLVDGDTVIFSSKIIPGNELALGELFNQLAASGVQVITEKDDFVHVSGHPGQADLRDMYGWTKPKHAIPVHGEYRHLSKHADLARSFGVESTLVPQNGDVITISADALVKVDEVPVGRLVLDGEKVIAADDPAIADRRRASYQGFITISLVLADNGDLLADPQVAMLGVYSADPLMSHDIIINLIEDLLERMPQHEREKQETVGEKVRIAVRRHFRANQGKNPGVAVLVTYLED
ncbi:MAG: ribonuclease J [Kordiimonadaceae bacterium]|nr:ribonuclease J [Kordiimonadaceae bacterium]MBO6570344.1 ribonuclease J [Kordiimonadaceae bacterium]MBO6965558.1 ribonuclease J [Kordiimonadaceae bacterium]